MNLARALVVGLALAGTGCGQNNITLDPSDELSEATQEAAEVWRPTLEGCGRSFDFGDRNVGAFIQYGDTGGVYALTSRAEPHEVVVDRDLVQSDHVLLVETLVHELGHVLGAKHTTDPADIMYPTPSPQRSDVPTAADVAQVCEH